MRRKSMTLLTIISVCLAGCSSAKVSRMQRLKPLTHPVNTISIAPSGGVLADAVGIELFSNGVNVIDTQQISNLMIRENLNEIELMKPQNLTKLREAGAEAFLTVRSVGGYDGKPQSASVRLVSTMTGELVCGVSWQNGRGGAQGSPADSMMRKDIVGAAKQITRELLRQLQ